MPTDNDGRKKQWLPLIALASHAAGDFPLQSDRMAARKFDVKSVRVAHVVVYTLSFVPMVRVASWNRNRSVVFLVALMGSHYLIDSKRWIESTEEFPTKALWFDQAYHLIALCFCVWLAEIDR